LAVVGNSQWEMVRGKALEGLACKSCVIWSKHLSSCLNCLDCVLKRI
jgi:hypothetical protein